MTETFSNSHLKMPNGIQIDIMQHLNVIYEVCVFRADRKNKMIAIPLIGLYILISPLKPLNRIKHNLTESKISISSTKFVFWEPIGSQRWLPRPLIGCDIFDSSETTERNSTKLDRKHNHNILYQFCVFRAD